MRTDFAAFILTHGRPDKVFTYGSLKRAGYTGPIYIIVDNEDKAINQYKEVYGDKVIVFDKAAVAKTFDEGDNFGDRRAIVYARNACFDIAKKLGYTYFIQLDDDYTRLQYKINRQMEYVGGEWILDLDRIIEMLLEYFIASPCSAISIAQGGDFIGGEDCSTWVNGFYPHRKCMNSFICSIERRFQFIGRVNEDVNTYTRIASTGPLFLTIPILAITQKQTQSNSGGMTEMYLDSGTYVKSFYTVMYSPSCTKIRMMGSTSRRLHHSIAWPSAVPVILDEGVKKVV